MCVARLPSPLALEVGGACSPTLSLAARIRPARLKFVCWPVVSKPGAALGKLTVLTRVLGVVRSSSASTRGRWRHGRDAGLRLRAEKNGIHPMVSLRAGSANRHPGAGAGLV